SRTSSSATTGHCMAFAGFDVEAAAAAQHPACALVDQELEEGLRSVAAPVRDRDGTVVAAVNIAVHAGRHTVDAVRRDLLPPLRATAAAIEADLRMAPAHRP
ncbi:IclR family transcriptional regulator domain-containing protein, partial [Streptomyces nigra]